MGCARYESMKLNNWFRDIVRICDTGKKQLEVSDPEIGKEAQYHLRQFIKYMKQLGRYY